MNHKRGTLAWLIAAVAFAPCLASAQIFITNLNRITVLTPGTLSVKTNAPAGQSFTAITNAIGWVDFLLDDANPSNGVPAKLHVNLREYVEDGKSGAVTGALMASTYSVTLTNGHLTGSRENETRFVFPTNVTLVVSNKYWWELVSDSGDDVRAHYYHLSYQGGDVLIDGRRSPNDPFSVGDMAFNFGTISQYPQFTNPRLVPTPTNVDFAAELNGVSGATSILEYSFDLITWTAFDTQGTESSFSLRASAVARSNAVPARFYRVRYLQER